MTYRFCKFCQGITGHAQNCNRPAPIPMPLLDDITGEARGWLADCGLRVSAGDDCRVIRTIHLNYDGGWPAFIAADQSLDEAVVWLFMVRRFGLEFANEMFGK